MAALWLFLGGLASGLVTLFLLRGTLSSERLERVNYRGVKLPTAAGVAFVPAFLMVWAVAVAVLSGLSGAGRQADADLITGLSMMLVAVLGFCLLGLLDDVAGDSGAKGFKGHFSEALHGRFTAGLVKAFLGFVVALVALAPLVLRDANSTPSNYGIWILDAALVALTANFFNLLDLRPGRALKVFFPAFALCAGLTLRYSVEGMSPGLTFQAAAGPGSIYLPYLYRYVAPALIIVAVAIVLFPGDLREKFMLGDAGSNVLGAVIGIGLVLGTSFWWRFGILILVLFLNILSEKYSFSKAISSNRALNWIDSLGRKGQEAVGDNNN